ncbi:DUF2147 domain-containing protein [Bradyrhizobium sp. SZCCHNR1015]|uniref:DUF2147 domain-containing protein n=1 Tax=unclassified Bradyrhizobium TaxID=2631580 RepID=UPI002916386C|nr:DUF2147 domain-containing protein [Bradyrhizobium sp. SZCCHNR1015]
MIGRFVVGLGVSLVLAAGPALADDVSGVWLRESGASKVRFAPCGGAICGTLVWIKEGTVTPAKVGQRLFSGMKPTGPNAWAGSYSNPDDGKTYDAKMTLSGGTLTTAGCAFGGVICRSSTWTRTN